MVSNGFAPYPETVQCTEKMPIGWNRLSCLFRMQRQVQWVVCYERNRTVVMLRLLGMSGWLVRYIALIISSVARLLANLPSQSFKHFPHIPPYLGRANLPRSMAMLHGQGENDISKKSTTWIKPWYCAVEYSKHVQTTWFYTSLIYFFHLFSQSLPDFFKPKTLGVHGQVLRAADWELQVHRLHPQGPQGPQGHRGHRVLVAWVAVTWGLAGCPSWGFSGCFKHIFGAKWDDPNSKLTTDDFAGLKPPTSSCLGTGCLFRLVRERYCSRLF